VREIVALSVANTWHLAKSEWALAEVYLADQPGACLCGHRPIREHCVIVNRENGNKAVVGNCCVKRFVGLPSASIFADLRRIIGDVTKAPSQALVNHAHALGWITDWEARFALDTLRLRRLSARQRAKRAEINRRLLARMAQTVGGRCHA
jgi:hypothetical protein